MGIFTSLEKRQWAPDDDRWFRPIYPTPSSGVEVTHDNALWISAVWAGVSIIAGTVATLPLKVYRRLNAGGKLPASEHHLWPVLHRRPNPWQTAVEFFEMMQGHLLLRGNAIAQIVRNSLGRIIQLIPLHPDRIRIKVEAGELVYYLRRRGQEDRRFTQDQILHVRGLSGDGIIGYSPVTLMCEALGLARATEQYGARFFKNDARPGGVLTTPKKLDKESRKNIEDSWNKAHAGSAKAHSAALLEQDLKWQSVGMTSEEAQFLETRKFQITEVARMLNLAPHKLRELDRSTHSNVEHDLIDFAVGTIRPWLVRWEQGFYQLFPESERDTYFAEFLLDGLMRGDAKSRSEALMTQFQGGSLSPNEWAEIEHRNPEEGEFANSRFVQLNMMPLSQAGMDLETGGGPGEEGRALLPAPGLELRSQRSVRQRNRYRLTYRKLLTAAGGRVVKRELEDLRRAIKETLGTRSAADLESRLSKIYQDLPEYIQRQMLPLLRAYAEVVQAAAAEEVNGEGGMTEEMENFVEAYTRTLAVRHVDSSRGQLEELIREANPDELEAVLTERLDEWEQKRPGKIGFRESVQFGAAVAKTVFVAAGFKTVWRTRGDTCPLCRKMEGRVVAGEGFFLKAGDTVDPEDGETEPLKAYRAVGHPQLHGGCDCYVVAGR